LQAKKDAEKSPRGDGTSSPRAGDVDKSKSPRRPQKPPGSRGQTSRLPRTTDGKGGGGKKSKRKTKDNSPRVFSADDWKNMTREEKREKARAEAEAALIAETKEAKHRAMKGADMAKPMAAEAEEMGATPRRNSKGELVVPYYPEIKAFHDRLANADIVPAKPLSYRGELEKLKKESAEDFRPPSRIMYSHHGLNEPKDKNAPSAW